MWYSTPMCCSRNERYPPENQNPFIFLHEWSIIVVSLCVYKACLTAWGLITYVCAAAVTQLHLGNPVSWNLRVTKTANYYYYYEGKLPIFEIWKLSSVWTKLGISTFLDISQPYTIILGIPMTSVPLWLIFWNSPRIMWLNTGDFLACLLQGCVSIF